MFCKDCGIKSDACDACPVCGGKRLLDVDAPIELLMVGSADLPDDDGPIDLN